MVLPFGLYGLLHDPVSNDNAWTSRRFGSIASERSFERLVEVAQEVLRPLEANRLALCWRPRREGLFLGLLLR